MATIVVAGGTGLLGTALVNACRRDGHTVAVLTRRPAREGDVRWSPGSDDASWAAVLDGADAVVNLAGTSIGSGRWTAARKAAIRESRVQATRALSAALRAARRPPSVFISSSAVGYYGNRGDEPLTEDSAPGSDFLARVCREWEAAAREAEPASRVVLTRSGVVLARGGGGAQGRRRCHRRGRPAVGRSDLGGDRSGRLSLGARDVQEARAVHLIAGTTTIVSPTRLRRRSGCRPLAHSSGGPPHARA